MAKAETVKGILNLGTILFQLKGVVSVTLIIIVLTSINAISLSIEQKSALPFVKSVGGNLLNHDTKLYLESKNIEDKGGFSVETSKPNGLWAKVKAFWYVIKSLGSALAAIWYLYFFGFLFYKGAILITNNDSAVSSNIVLAALFLVIIQVFAGFVIVDQNAETDKLSITEKITPFKGIVKFISVVPLLSNPIYTLVSDIDESKQLASELNKTMQIPNGSNVNAQFA